MKWGASGMMKNHPYKKYIYAAVSLFGVIVLSIIVFFIIFRYGEIKQALRHIFNTLMPFIIGAALAYMICPLCRTIEKFYLRILEKTERIKQAKKEKLALTASVFTGIFITLVVIYLIIIIIVPQLITSVIRLVQILPDSADRLVKWLEKMLNSNEQLLAVSQVSFYYRLALKRTVRIRRKYRNGIIKRCDQFLYADAEFVYWCDCCNIFTAFKKETCKTGEADFI